MVERYWPTAAIILLLSATLFIIGVLGYYLSGEHYQEKFSISLPMRLALGEGRNIGDVVEIQKLSPQGLALLVGPNLQLPAKDFPTLEWQIEGMSSATALLFLWNTSATPKQAGTLALTDGGTGQGVSQLSRHPRWRRTIQGVGLMIQGQLAKPLILHRLVLRPAPPSVAGLLQQLWSDWTDFEGWNGYSINFIIGGSRYGLISPVLAAAAWVGLSILLYSGLLLFRRLTWSIKPFLLFFLAGWLALDFRWQADLWQQLQMTWKRYAGKSWEEKQAAAPDGELFTFIQRVKLKLPAEPARILLLMPEPGGQDQYLWLRAHYHLLPHNVSSRWRFPPQEGLQAGDYILILKSIPGLKFDPKSASLQWGQNQRLKVEPLLIEASGSLFKVL
jgi:hypothetical protein